jgi:hypothetical protein
MDVVRWELMWEDVMIVDVIRQADFIEVQRTRKLPFPGRLLVKMGDSVSPEDVVAEGSIPDGFVVIDLCKALGVPLDDVASCLVREEGEWVQKDDILAQSEGAIERVIRAPADGKIVDCTQGEIILASGENLVQARAGMVGVVDEVLPEVGVIIKARGTLLQGCWGNGHFGSGTLRVIEESIEESLSGDHLESIEPGQVVAVGSCQDAEPVLNLAEKGVKGILIGVLSTSLIAAVNSLGIPVMVLQGFGDFPPDKNSFALMKSREGALASINASQVDRTSGCRPEVILQWEGDKGEGDLGFRSELLPGQRVQVNSGAYWGKMGVVIDLPRAPIHFESGLLALSAVVQLDHHEDVVSVPHQNLVIIRE